MNRLRQIRERKSLSLAQVSARTSIPIRLLTEYEQGQTEISPAHLKALAKALWVKPDEIVPPGGADSGVAAPVPDEMAVQVAQPVEARAAVAAPAPPAPAYAPRPAYAPSAPPNGGYNAARPPLPPGPRPAPQGAPAFSPDAPPRPAPRSRPRRDPVPMPATEGQVTEIMRLSARLNLSTEQLATKFERPLADLSRFDAREWIKVLREEAITKAPPAKVHFGQWPGLKDDLEAVYLTELKNERALLKIALFNGQLFEGQITDFTPYTITVAAGEGIPTVLRKLAVAYYQRVGQAPEGATASEGAEKNEHEVAPFPGPATPGFAAPGSNGSSEAGAEQ